MRTKISVLVAEDDELFREVIRTILESLGYQVQEAGNGMDAIGFLGAGSYDVIISDVRMPIMDGLKLLEHAKANTQSKFILMTGFSEVLEAQKAYQMGADEFLPKPFTKDELMKTLALVLNGNDMDVQPNSVNLDPEFCKLSIETFITGTRLTEDVFLRLSEKKYVKVAAKDTSLPADRIRHYVTKGVRHLYMTKENFARYVGLNIKMMNQAREMSGIDSARRLEFIKYNSELMMSEVYVEGLDRNRYQDACEIVDNIVSLLSEESSSRRLLEILREGGSLYTHSLGVSIYSCLIAKAHGWHAPTTLYRLSVAALLHDIGFKTIPDEILEKSPLEWTRDEQKIFQGHTLAGRDILMTVPGLPEDVATVALQHHENLTGLGYPQRTRKEQIHPFARVVAVADTFCELVMKSPHTPGMEPLDAYKKLTTSFQNELDPDFVAALGMLLANVPAKKKVNQASGL